MIRIYNTLRNQKEDFVPVVDGKAGIYCCGPTVYNYIHLGNARPLVVFDAVRRYLLYRGFKVRFVQNFTDVDDKIINRAKEEGDTPANIARKYVKAYFEDAAALSVLPADVHPKVTEHMPEIIGMIGRIIERGHAYAAEGDVYFDVRSLPGYGELSRRELDDMLSGARVEPGSLKRDPLDFALWKAAKPGEPAWESPWGLGRPGWHIECSAMSSKYLGDVFDIHGGGADLVFPHHENELAQSRAASGQEFARYWMHNGFITVNMEKMSKSLGNFFLLRDILRQYSGDVVRFYLLSTHYRSPIDFADDKLEMAQKSLERIRNSWFLLQEGKKKAGGGSEPQFLQTIKQAEGDFISAMDDDFNTALAIGVIFDFCRELNIYLQGGGETSQEALTAAEELFRAWDGVLGALLPREKEDDGLAEGLLQLIIELRQTARAKKDWAAADAIRDGLKALGIALEDTSDGVRWRKL